tara:strand:+ start:754 stop:1305 length:552 start_codon:yes stop_codon:yes gene_type:complete
MTHPDFFKNINNKKKNSTTPILYMVAFLCVLILFLSITFALANENGDLSGTVYPVSVVKEVKVSETVDKTIEILEKIEKVQKEKDKIYYDKITLIEPKKAADQYCYVKIVIKQSGENIVKEEILECADGRKKVDGPSYWELFAQFYYRDVNVPEYCRYYSRPNHVFKSFGKTCLNKDGEWKVQ